MKHNRVWTKSLVEFVKYFREIVAKSMVSSSSRSAFKAWNFTEGFEGNPRSMTFGKFAGNQTLKFPNSCEQRFGWKLYNICEKYLNYTISSIILYNIFFNKIPFNIIFFSSKPRIHHQIKKDLLNLIFFSRFSNET